MRGATGRGMGGWVREGVGDGPVTETSREGLGLYGDVAAWWCGGDYVCRC